MRLQFQFSFLFLLIILNFPTYLCQDDIRHSNCTKSTFTCGNIINIKYPFWGNGRPYYCGHPNFQLQCTNGFPEINIMFQRYRVLNITEQERTLRIARVDMWDNACLCLNGTILNSTLFSYSQKVVNMTMLYGCSTKVPATVSNQNSWQINDTCSGNDVFYVTLLPQSRIPTCRASLVVPVLETAVGGFMSGNGTIGTVLKQGFDLQYSADVENCDHCRELGGECGFNATLRQSTCFCPSDKKECIADAKNRRIPPKGPRGTHKKLVTIVATLVGTVIAAVVSTIVICCWLRRKSCTSMILWKRKPTNATNLEAFLKDCGPLAPKKYKYSDVKKMTNTFKDKLGQGGYGTVFKGQLSDGQMVAVKILSETKGNGNEFINEVASISRTSHVNVVSLLGFCLEGPKRALIYEFMHNGSLEKFIYGETPTDTHPHLGWDTLYKVAIGIARGLEYLHRGCNTRILHFDIKPHNILLDQDFSPKIADFGLSKLCNVKESIISMTGARGTPGYIAPEVVSRNFGGVSHKSDVYSYGMMILEMVGGRKNIDPRVINLSEIYFPHWIHKRLELDEDLGVHGITSAEDHEIAKKMVVVGLWCIQIDPLNRPPMSKVLDMLEGSLEALQIPPKPFFSSPSRGQENSSPSRPAGSSFSRIEEGSSASRAEEGSSLSRAEGSSTSRPEKSSSSTISIS